IGGGRSMGKRFVPVRDADKRAIRLHLMLKQVEQMPLIDLRLHADEKNAIVIIDKRNPARVWAYTVDQFLGLDVEQAKAAGGTAVDLVCSRKAPQRPRLPQSEIDRAVDDFMSGDEET